MTPAEAAAPPRRGRPRAETSHLIRGRLLDAAWRVLVKQGFEGFTIDKVARRARASKATLYARFEGRTALLRAALEHELERSIFVFPAYDPDSDLAESLVAQCLGALQQLASEDGRMIERLIQWLDTEEPGQPLRHTIYERALRNTEKFIAEATAQGVLDGTADTARLWFEGLLGHARLTCWQPAIDWTAQEKWARQFVAYHLAAAGYRPKAS